MILYIHFVLNSTINISGLKKCVNMSHIQGVSIYNVYNVSYSHRICKIFIKTFTSCHLYIYFFSTKRKLFENNRYLNISQITHIILFKHLLLVLNILCCFLRHQLLHSHIKLVNCRKIVGLTFLVNTPYLLFTQAKIYVFLLRCYSHFSTKILVNCDVNNRK